jgi:anti-sigma regulatory factor (Ser/Thr protein kinase)/serine/threonine protein phosphatase PrpC
MGFIAVREQSQVAEARRRAAAVAGSLRASETVVGNVSIIATELATNLVRHGQGGEVLVQPWKDAEGSGIELLALDRGRGMEDVAACFVDGYSTAGTPGTGLGAIRRLASFIDIWSRPGMGTALLVRLRLGPAADASPSFRWGAVSQPAPGEEQCGDAWSVLNGQARAAFLVADGLGHGPLAAAAAEAAVRLFEERGLRDSPAEAMQAIHRGIASTRGAAASIALIRANSDDMLYCGVGNIAGTVFANGGSRKTVSMSGTLGHAMGRAREFTYPLPAGALLVMHSDGLLTNWSLDSYPDLLTRHPALIAGIVYRDFRRGRDDATVLVVRRTA